MVRLFILVSFFTFTLAAEQITFDQHVKPLIKEHCLNCHNPDKMKADLDLSTFAGTMKGGSSGEIVKAGVPDSSMLYMTITHHEDAEPMPPKKPKLSDAKIKIFREWILQGLVESKGGKSKLRKIENIVMSGTVGKPVELPMPQVKLPKVINKANRQPVIKAMSVSPWAPLIAVGGTEQVLLYQQADKNEGFVKKWSESDAPTGAELIGTLPFPEGIIYDMKFSKNGSVLLVSGGQGAHSGKVVLFDIKTGERLAVIGDEQDAILSADISYDHKYVAIGTAFRMVKIYRVKDGEMIHKIKKHTDWVTSVAFAPNSDYVATGDRNGGVHIWEARTGAIVLSLNDHKETITGLAWRADAKMLASASEDGKVIMWDMSDGWPSKVIDAHVQKSKVRYTRNTGVLSIDWAKDGTLVTAGRDRKIKLWKIDGNIVKDIYNESLLPSAVSLSQNHIFVGGFDGYLRVVKR